LCSNPPIFDQDLVKPIRVVGVGEVTLEELEAMLLAYVNAGAPKPVLEGTPQEKEKILREVASRGDSQMQALIDSLLKE
jgi:hypothetical protein